MKRVLVTGITGQDGSYMAEFLLEKGYEVFGLARRSSHDANDRIEHILDRIHIVDGDLTDQSSLDEAINKIRPDEVYNFAAQSFVPTSWSQPVLTADVTGVGVARVLEAIRKYHPKARFYQASSSEMFGQVVETPQRENTRFYPRSPYGVAKVYAHYLTINYRESYDIFACSGICFNHESPRRGPEFVTRKISRTTARIKLGIEKQLKLGNLDAERDWGFAGDHIKAMWMMLQQDKPKDYVIATGETHTVRDFARNAFATVGLDWEKYVVIDPKLFRPAEVNALIGDPTMINKDLGWKPEMNFQGLVETMVMSDLKHEAMSRGLPVPDIKQKG